MDLSTRLASSRLPAISSNSSMKMTASSRPRDFSMTMAEIGSHLLGAVHHEHTGGDLDEPPGQGPGDGLGKMGLAGARRPEKNDRLGGTTPCFLERSRSVKGRMIFRCTICLGGWDSAMVSHFPCRWSGPPSHPGCPAARRPNIPLWACSIFSRKSMQATRRPTSRPSFSDMSHLCCKILGHRSAATSGSNLVPLVSKILCAHNSGVKVSVNSALTLTSEFG